MGVNDWFWNSSPFLSSLPLAAAGPRWRLRSNRWLLGTGRWGGGGGGPRGERLNGGGAASCGCAQPQRARPQTFVLGVNGERAPIRGRFLPQAPPPSARPLPGDPDVTGTFPPPPPSACVAELSASPSARTASCPAQPRRRVRAPKPARTHHLHQSARYPEHPQRSGHP